MVSFYEKFGKKFGNPKFSACSFIVQLANFMQKQPEY